MNIIESLSDIDLFGHILCSRAHLLGGGESNAYLCEKARAPSLATQQRLEATKLVHSILSCSVMAVHKKQKTSSEDDGCADLPARGVSVGNM